MLRCLGRGRGEDVEGRRGEDRVWALSTKILG